MSAAANDVWLAGVDGCPGGWIAAFTRPAGGDGSPAIFARLADVLAAPERPAVIAIDIPIGLPDRVGARRLHAGSARPFPDPPPRDTYGLPMAISA